MSSPTQKSRSDPSRFLIGIDDTDNVDTRGTGYRARRLCELLASRGFPGVGVTRHQLLVDPRIPYTSHNSSACLEVAARVREDERTDAGGEADTVAVCRDYLRRHSAPESDVGLCVARRDRVHHGIVAFGERAKVDILTPMPMSLRERGKCIWKD